jgi:uncharacterized protein (DUF2384 family)
MGVDPMAAMSSVMLVVAVSIHAAEQRPSIMVRAWTRRRESTRAREKTGRNDGLTNPSS